MGCHSCISALHYLFLVDATDSYEKHDRRYHGGHFDPDKQTCGLRERDFAEEKSESIADNGMVESHPIGERERGSVREFVHKAMNGEIDEFRHEENVSDHTPVALAMASDAIFGLRKDGVKHEDFKILLNQRVWNKDAHTPHDISEADYGRILDELEHPVAILRPTGRHADVIRVIVRMKDNALCSRSDKPTDLSCLCLYRKSGEHAFSVNTIYGIEEGVYDKEPGVAVYVDSKELERLDKIGIRSGDGIFDDKAMAKGSVGGWVRRPFVAKRETSEYEELDKSEPAHAEYDAIRAWCGRHGKDLMNRMDTAIREMPRSMRKQLGGISDEEIFLRAVKRDDSLYEAFTKAMKASSGDSAAEKASTGRARAAIFGIGASIRNKMIAKPRGNNEHERIAKLRHYLESVA